MIIIIIKVIVIIIIITQIVTSPNNLKYLHKCEKSLLLYVHASRTQIVFSNM